MEIQFRDHVTLFPLLSARQIRKAREERFWLLLERHSLLKFDRYGGDVFPNVFPGEIVFQTVFASIRRDGGGGGGLINGTRN